MKTLQRQIDEERARVAAMTAWRIEGTLREFPRFEPVDLWFRHPIHYLDNSQSLKDVSPEMEKSSYQTMIEARQKKAKKEKEDIINQIEIAFEGMEENGVAPAIDIAEQIGVTPDTIKRWFGNGKRSRTEYKKKFSTFVKDEDQKLYLKRL